MKFDPESTEGPALETDTVTCEESVPAESPSSTVNSNKYVPDTVGVKSAVAALAPFMTTGGPET
jgi:hypothetical protein